MLMFVIGEIIEHYPRRPRSGYLTQRRRGPGCGCDVEVYEPVMGINKGLMTRFTQDRALSFPFLDVHKYELYVTNNSF